MLSGSCDTDFEAFDVIELQQLPVRLGQTATIIDHRFWNEACMSGGVIEFERRNPNPGLEAASTRQLAERALEATRSLVRAEVALAEDELHEQIKSATVGLWWGAAAFALLILALETGLMAIMIASGSAVRLAVGLVVLLGCAALVTAWLSYRAWPKLLLSRTRARLSQEAALLGRKAL